MVVDVTLLERLRSAKDAIITALSVSSISATSHAHQEAPRDGLCARRRLEAFDHDVQQVDDEFRYILESGLSALAIVREDIKVALSPVRSLPPELLSDIFERAVTGPDDRTTTLRLSHVCRVWRMCVLDTSSLFTVADWNSWPGSACLEWCTRAKARPLSVHLNAHTLWKLYSPSGSELVQALKQTKEAWADLHLSVSSALALERMNRLLCQYTFQNVVELDITSPIHITGGEGSVDISPLNFPNLRDLCLVDCHASVVQLQYFANLRTVSLTLPSFRPWPGWSEMFQSLSHLASLRIAGVCLGHVQNMSLLSIPTLETLVTDNVTIEIVTELLNSMLLPNLRSLHIIGGDRIRRSPFALPSVSQHGMPKSSCILNDPSRLLPRPSP